MGVADDVQGSQSTIGDGEIEKEAREEQHVVNDFANGGPVQEDLGQHAQQKETGELIEDRKDTEKQTVQVSAKQSIHNTSSVPNGGLQAWLQVLGAFFLFFNSW